VLYWKHTEGSEVLDFIGNAANFVPTEIKDLKEGEFVDLSRRESWQMLVVEGTYGFRELSEDIGSNIEVS
jgi:hypothetical protein